MKKVLRILGVVMAVLAAGSFLVVADDLRHIGELLGAGSLLLAGIAAVVASYSDRLGISLRVEWFAAGLLAGALAGAVADSMPIGVGAGAAIGLVLSYALRKRKAGSHS